MDEREPNISRLVQNIFAAQPDDLHCDQAASQIGRCGAASLSDEAMQAQYPALWRHLQVCADCAEEYEMVMGFARQDRAAQGVRPVALPPRPVATELPLWEQAKQIFVTLLTRAGDALALPPSWQPLALRSVRGELGVDPVEMVLPEAGVTLLLEMVPHTDPAYRDLLCTVEPQSSSNVETLDGSPVWLQQDTEGPIVQEAMLNEHGDVTLEALLPGTYSLHLYLAGTGYLIRGITIP